MLAGYLGKGTFFAGLKSLLDKNVFAGLKNKLDLWMRSQNGTHVYLGGLLCSHTVYKIYKAYI